MAIPYGTIVAGAVGSAIAYFFQNRKTTLDNARALRVSELAKAKEIFTSLTEQIGTLLYYNQESMYGTVYRNLQIKPAGEVDAVDLENWTKYQAALTKWKEGKSRLFGQAKQYFDEATYQLLLKINGEKLEVKLDPDGNRLPPTSTGLEHLEQMVNATYFQIEGHPDLLVNDVNSPNFFKTKYRAVAGPLEKDATELAAMMTDQIQRVRVGALG